MAFNKVIIHGNLTRDPELTFTQSQVAVCKFGVAINQKYRSKTGEDREDVVFVDVTAFEKQAELINQHFTKGAQILFEGRLKLDTWDDRESGAKRSKLYILLDRFTFVGSKRDGEEDQPQQQTTRRPSGRPGGRPAAATAPSRGPEEDAGFKEDDIPF
jgi:single-strand DNA-binding protein